MSNIFIGLKKRLVWVVLDIEGVYVTNDNEIGLKEGGGIEMSIYSAFHIRDARSLRFEYLPILLLIVSYLALGNFLVCISL